MTLPVVNSSLSKNGKMSNGKKSDFELAKSDFFGSARLFFWVACLWPVIVLALFAVFAPLMDATTEQQSTEAVLRNFKFNLRSVLDRVDVLGYGPTHPRVAVVLVGEDADSLVRSLKSVFANTDLNRLFVICVVVDGKEQDDELVKQMQEIDSGATPHWHGLVPDQHNLEGDGFSNATKKSPAHGRKLHVLFNKNWVGLTASRSNAVDFIKLLEHRHEKAGLKSPEEDLILLLLDAGAELNGRKWLQHVTDALIVPPPLLQGAQDDKTVAMKMANAVSFNVEGPGKRTAFDVEFKSVISEVSPEELSPNSGTSYPAPALAGAATAMRLETYLNLPSHDATLTADWPANLDLSLSLWLCADGIDMLSDVQVIENEKDPKPPAPLPAEEAARFAAAWMDAATRKKYFHAYTLKNPELTSLEWDTLVAKARESPTFPQDLHKKCRPFPWFVQERLGNVWDNSAWQSSSEAEKQGPRKPSKPLRPECLEIVQKATPVDITFVDVSNGHREHPHGGARDADGNVGYVFDETALRRNPPPFSFQGNALVNACLNRDTHYRMIKEKVFVDVEAHMAKVKAGVKRDKIFCVVYTIESGHPNIPRIHETWGPKCDGFMVASNKTDPNFGTVDIVHQGPEEYDNIWQKVRSIWSYVYDYYYDKYDWFHIGGDDLYLIVENLRLYLESEEIKTAANGGIYLPIGNEKMQTPLFLGRRFAYMGDMNDIFNSGGSGYTLNKAALKLLVTEGFPNYFPNARTFSEDTMVAHVLRKFGVYPYETKDETGAERYMPFMPGDHYDYRLPDDKNSDWYARYSINIKEGVDHCADRSVAFHYIKGNFMYRLHALLYHLCPADTQ